MGNAIRCVYTVVELTKDRARDTIHLTLLLRCKIFLRFVRKFLENEILKIRERQGNANVYFKIEC